MAARKTDKTVEPGLWIRPDRQLPDLKKPELVAVSPDNPKPKTREDHAAEEAFAKETLKRLGIKPKSMP